MTTKDNFNSLFNEFIRQDNLNYITIKPIDYTKSFEQFKFLLKKVFRDISKNNNLIKSYDYIKFLGVVEVSGCITKNKKQIFDLGLHSHIFYNPVIDLFNTVEVNEFRDLIIHTFLKYGIIVNVYCTDKFYNIQRFGSYHTKQMEVLNDEFIITNIKKTI